MSRSLLVYDGSVEVLRATAEALTARAADLRAVAWDRPEVQAFLEAQFGDRPFALILVEDDTVHVGSATVRRVLEAQDLPEAVVDLFEEAYPAVSGPFGRLVHGREPADLDGSFPLAAAARPHVESLRRSHEVPVEPE